MRTYYHVARGEDEEKILNEGIKSTDADECPSGRGIHVTRTVEDAISWAGLLRAERNERDKTYIIIRLRASDEFERDDEFPNKAPADGFVLCKERIKPENMKIVEWMY